MLLHHYDHKQEKRPNQLPLSAAEPGRVFYVSVRSDSRSSLALGPFDTHLEALDRVDTVRAWVLENIPFGHFMAFGTASVKLEDPETAPAGKLNAHLLT